MILTNKQHPNPVWATERSLANYVTWMIILKKVFEWKQIIIGIFFDIQNDCDTT